MYEYIIRQLILDNNIKVKIFRDNLSGCAWYKKREIEIPRANTPLRLSIALHEIGHILLRHNNKIKRYLEEKQAWDYAIKMMRLNNMPITKKVRDRRKRSIKYAIGKAIRRGLKTKINKGIYEVA